MATEVMKADPDDRKDIKLLEEKSNGLRRIRGSFIDPFRPALRTVIYAIEPP